jgi:Short C-terminal domain/Bacterial PH domain
MNHLQLRPIRFLLVRDIYSEPTQRWKINPRPFHNRSLEMVKLPGMSELIIKVQSNMVLAADLRPSVLYIYDDRIAYFSNIGVTGGQETYINYDQIAQVNQLRGFIESSLEIINTGGQQSVTIEHLTNNEAQRAKETIEQRANLARTGGGTNVPTPPTPTESELNIGYSDSITQGGVELLEDLAKLRDQGILTENEFEQKKRQILDRI